MSAATASPRAVVDAYIKGTRTRDVALLKSIFHDDAVMTGWFGPDFAHGGPEPFFDEIAVNEVGPDYTAEITDLTVTDRIASAVVSETNLMGMSFTNHFHLAQLGDGSWRITSKLYRHH